VRGCKLKWKKSTSVGGACASGASSPSSSSHPHLLTLEAATSVMERDKRECVLLRPRLRVVSNLGGCRAVADVGVVAFHASGQLDVGRHFRPGYVKI